MGAAWFLFELKTPVFWVESRKSREPYVPLILNQAWNNGTDQGGGGGGVVTLLFST